MRFACEDIDFSIPEDMFPGQPSVCHNNKQTKKTTSNLNKQFITILLILQETYAEHSTRDALDVVQCLKGRGQSVAVIVK